MLREPNRHNTVDLEQQTLKLVESLDAVITGLENLSQSTSSEEVNNIENILNGVYEIYFSIAQHYLSDDRILHFFLHEIRNRTSGISMSLYMISSFKNTSKQFSKYTSSALKEAVYIRNNLLNNLLTLDSKIESVEFSLQEVFDLLDYSIAMSKSTHSSIKFKFGISIFTMMLILSEIKINAINKHKATHLDVSVMLDSSNLYIKFKDEGEGIAEERLAEINYNLTQPSANRDEIVAANSEFGLRAIKSLGIDVQIDSPGLGKGTTVTLGFAVEAIKES